MLPSSTVENYLKAIYQGVATLTPPHRLLPMGQLALALGVVPGTATTMVKALAESGLVEYEPYSGVALTPAGHKLAALVLRRHRLVELFLVRFMGYAWDEVHDEAEQLEHVVSDRLIDRMDEMLGRPEVDPHGDPIPDAEGQVKTQDAQSLMTCPIGAPVTVTRVVDQDGSFLRFLERHQLKPGAEIQVEERDASADSVRVRGEGDRLITIGTRAASKLLVQVTRAALLLLLAVAPALAQEPATAAATPRAAAPRTNLSGYMDFHYNKPEFSDGVLDFHRFVLLVTHSFSDRIRFVSEVEIEHAALGRGEDAIATPHLAAERVARDGILLRLVALKDRRDRFHRVGRSTHRGHLCQVFVHASRRVKALVAALDLAARHLGVDSQPGEGGCVVVELPDDRHAVSELERLHQVVRDEDHRLAKLALQPDHFVLHVAPDQRVERAERLVEEHDLGVHGERPGETDPLLLAAGQLIRVVVCMAVEADQCEHLAGALLPR
jgi:DtxR family Mn-dependent transcriptional regulator